MEIKDVDVKVQENTENAEKDKTKEEQRGTPRPKGALRVPGDIWLGTPCPKGEPGVPGDICF